VTPPVPDRSFDREDLLDDPLAQSARWLADAEEAGIPMPNAIALATVAADGTPAVRHVLLRGIDERGFVFHTNRRSRKGRHLEADDRVAFVLFWKELERQLSVTGRAAPLDDAGSDAYFESRPREAQIGAWASPQSEVIPDRRALDESVEEVTARFEGAPVPRPPHWGGYVIRPDTVEFWQGRAHRLHDRFRFTADRSAATGWTVERLAP
jgi:pyridoxamine 5'-phosphate oxidase